MLSYTHSLSVSLSVSLSLSFSLFLSLPPSLPPSYPLPPSLLSDEDRIAALQAALTLVSQLELSEDNEKIPSSEEDREVTEFELQQQLKEARTRQMFSGAGLSRYVDMASQDGVTLITLLYSQLPLEEDRPGV